MRRGLPAVSNSREGEELGSPGYQNGIRHDRRGDCNGRRHEDRESTRASAFANSQECNQRWMSNIDRSGS